MSYFEEKAYQIIPDNFIAFGIKIASSHGKATEIIEMINFAKLINEADISQYVDKVFYNSEECVCTFELNTTIQGNSLTGQKFIETVRKSISQYIIMLDDIEIYSCPFDNWRDCFKLGAL